MKDELLKRRSLPVPFRNRVCSLYLLRFKQFFDKRKATYVCLRSYRNPKQNPDVCIWTCNEVTNTPSTYILAFPSILISILSLLPLDYQTLISLPFSPREGVSPPHSFLVSDFKVYFQTSPSNQRQA